MKKRFSTRSFKSLEYRNKRSPFRSARQADRECNMVSSRGVLRPVIRGCSEPRWLREA